MQKKLLKTLGVASLALTLSGAQADDKLKIGFIYVGPVGDFGWSYQHDQGRQVIAEKFADKVETTYVESVKEGADTERVINQLVSSGNQLIFTTSFGFMNPTVKAAKRNPQVHFEHATGYKQADNLATYSSRFYEGRYIAGILAGSMTKSNVVGYVASHPIPEVVRGINATLLGLRQVNPDATIKVVWVNSWYDPAKETEAAKSLINAGADVLMQHTDSPAVPQIGEENDVWVVGSATDMVKFAPTKQLTAIIDDWSQYYTRRVEAELNGSWESVDTWGGFKEKMVELAPFNSALSADTIALANNTRSQFEAGGFNPFMGPLTDRDGKEVAKEGEALTDEQLLQMNYFLKGIEGDLPK